MGPANPEAEKPVVTFVVPTFNRARDLPRTLGAIAAQTWGAERMRIVVVDNASTDDTPAVLAGLAARLPVTLQHIRKKPEGPAAARNLGLRLAEGEFVAFVDSDVALRPGWTEATVAAMRADPRLALVGGKVVFGHDTAVLNCFGGAISRFGLAWDLAEGDAADSVGAPRAVLWMNNSATLARREPVLAADGFDDTFFYGYEEADLGLRLALAGWRACVVPEAEAVHHVGTEIGMSDPTIVFHYTKNRLSMALKTFAGRTLLWWVPAALAYGLADAMPHAPRGARLSAHVHVLRHLPSILRRRRVAQMVRTCPDRDAFALMAREWFPPRRLAGLRRRTVRGSTVAATQDDRVGRPA
jgi:GT2 family glycosyltransferase